MTVESAGQCVLEWARDLVLTDMPMTALGLLQVYYGVVPPSGKRPSGTIWVDPADDSKAQGNIYQGTAVAFRLGFHADGAEPRDVAAFRKRSHALFPDSRGDLPRSWATALGVVTGLMRLKEWSPEIEWIQGKPFVGMGDFYSCWVRATET